MENPRIISKLSSIALDELGLSVLSYNSLRRAGVVSLFDLYSLIQEGSISKIQNIGEISEKAILSKLENFVENYKKTQARDLHENTQFKLESNEFTDGISVILLEDELGGKLVNQLQHFGIETLGELSDFIIQISNVVENNEKVIALAIEDLEQKVKEKIKNTGLQAGIFVDGKKLYSILYQIPETEKSKIKKFNILQKMLETHSLNEELDLVYQGLLTRDRHIFVLSTLNKFSVRDLGKRFNLSDARVRQILIQTLEIISEQIKENIFPYLQSVFLIADDLGQDLSEKRLKSRLIKCGMISLHNQNRSYNLYDLLLALLINPRITSIIEMKKQE